MSERCLFLLVLLLCTEIRTVAEANDCEPGWGGDFCDQVCSYPTPSIGGAKLFPHVCFWPLFDPSQRTQPNDLIYLNHETNTKLRIIIDILCVMF